MKILVIEDEPTSRKLASLVLQCEGHQVVDVESAEEAIDIVSVQRPDLILVDLALPGMNGLVLARRLKEDSQTRSIPIVAVTSYPDRFPREAAFDAGCDAFIVKPIDTRKLPAQVAAAAANHSQSGPI
jgi:CheY-like chemotaxis protein